MRYQFANWRGDDFVKKGRKKKNKNKNKNVEKKEEEEMSC